MFTYQQKNASARIKNTDEAKVAHLLSNFVELQIRTLLYPYVPINRFIQNIDSSEIAGKAKW